ncbi:MAG: exodeoxyribonuclease VII large subunit, partial [Pseudomonadota bacterium]
QPAERRDLGSKPLDDASRRPLPPPRVIGVVTSPTGAVIRDILHRLADRFPAHVLVWPVAVQGPGSAASVAEAIRGFNAMAPGGPIPRPDVLIVARGGGSIEDLWGFNEEIVVRAAAASEIPLISAVGHETDTTLIDYAADRRAPTPTAAAEMAVPVRADLAAALAELEARRRRAMRRMLDARRERLAAIARALPRGAEIVETRRQRLAALRLPDPRRLVADGRARLGLPAQRLAPGLRARVGRARLALERPAARLTDRALRQQVRQGRERSIELGHRLAPAILRSMRRCREALTARGRLLETLSFRRTLERGYAVVRDGTGRLVMRAGDVAPDTAVALQFADGTVDAVTRSGAADGPPSPPPTAPQSPPAPPSRPPKTAVRRRAPTPAGQGSLFDDDA